MVETHFDIQVGDAVEGNDDYGTYVLVFQLFRTFSTGYRCMYAFLFVVVEEEINVHIALLQLEGWVFFSLGMKGIHVKECEWKKDVEIAFQVF